MLRASAVAAILAIGCDTGSTFFVERSWPADHLAILAIMDEQMQPLEDAPRVLAPTDPIRVVLPLPARISLFVQTYAPGRLDPSCEIHFGPGPLLPTADTVWVSGVVDVGARQIELEPAEDGDHPTISATLCQTRSACDRVRVESIDHPYPTNDLRFVTVVSSTLAFIVSQDFDLIRLGPSGAEPVPRDPRLVGESGALVWNRADAIFGSDEQLLLFALDLTGAVRTVWQAPEPKQTVVSGEDGTTLLLTQPRRLFRIAPASAEPFPTPPSDLSELHVVRRDRILGADADGSMFFFDGSSWRFEIETGVSVDAIAGDGAGFLAIQPVLSSYLRNDRGEWQTIDAAPLLGAHAVSIGGGRYLVVGENGLAAIWDGQTWCNVPTRVAQDFTDVAASPDGTTAFATSEVKGVASLILRFDLTELADR